MAKLKLVCGDCGKVINTTDEIEGVKCLRVVYDDAIINPLLGWCDDCDLKPMPVIVDGDVEYDSFEKFKEGLNG